VTDLGTDQKRNIFIGLPLDFVVGVNENLEMHMLNLHTSVLLQTGPRKKWFKAAFTPVSKNP
jgi:hypothetical protein